MFLDSVHEQDNDLCFWIFFLALKSYLVMILDRLIDFLVIKKKKFDRLEKPITVNFVNQKQAM